MTDTNTSTNIVNTNADNNADIDDDISDDIDVTTDDVIDTITEVRSKQRLGMRLNKTLLSKAGSNNESSCEADSNKTGSCNAKTSKTGSCNASAHKANMSKVSPSKAKHRRLLLLLSGVALLVLASVAACLVGSSSVGLEDLFALITDGSLSGTAKNILINVRFPRVAAALLSGAALAVSGAILQAVLDNPMASPNIIGINSGAGLAVLLAGAIFPHVYALSPLAAFVGALVAALLIFGISFGTQLSRLTVVLAGLAISTVFGAGMNAVLIIEPDAYINASGFIVGGLSGVNMQSLLFPALFILLALPVGIALSGRLNIMALGDTRAHSLGMNVRRTRLFCLAVAALLAGAAVSFAGLLGFVGLVVPHVMRFLVGHNNRMVIPFSIIGGAAFVVICDLAARTLFSPYELPVGIVMAFLGGPFFIYLIVKNRGFADVR